MRTTLKYLLCICVLVCGVYTLRATYAHSLEEAPDDSGNYLCAHRVTLSVSEKDETLLNGFAWLNSEKSANTIHIPFVELRETEEDETHSFDRLGAACITSIFLAILCGRSGTDTLSAFGNNRHFPALSHRYLIFQVFRI